MSPSEHAVELIQRAEGLSLTAYGDGDSYSIGFGHHPSSLGETITAAQADDLFERDLHSAATTVKGLVRVPLNQGEFDALLSFVYNFGGTKFSTSTLLTKLNRSDYGGARAEFEKWVHVDGAPVVGLRVRRRAEQERWSGATASAAITSACEFYRVGAWMALQDLRINAAQALQHADGPQLPTGEDAARAAQSLADQIKALLPLWLTPGVAVSILFGSIGLYYSIKDDF